MTKETAAPNRTDRAARAVLLVLLTAVPAIFVLHQQCVNDADVWWHLRAGEWIVQHHGVPTVDPFSNIGNSTPWAAYSWLFELIMFFLYGHWGLVGILVYTASMVVAIATALYRLLQRLQPDFTKAILLALAASLGMGRLYTPRPWLFTVLLFILELDIVLSAYGGGIRNKARKWKLLWLPLIFAVWANVHIQFIDGLLVLLLAAVTPLLTQVAARVFNLSLPQHGHPLREAGRRTAVFAACVLATFLNPYGWKLYVAAWQLASQGGVLDKVSELQAIPFRDTGDYLVLFLTIGACVALAWKRRFEMFELCLLVVAIGISFRSQRDVWVVVIVAVVILADPFLYPRIFDTAEPRRNLSSVAATPALLIAASLTVFLAGKVMRISNMKLQALLVTTMPVRAIEFAKSHGYGGPLYNTYDWGGILIWDLRLPVSMDGRAALYGDQRIERSVATWSGRPGWDADPELACAHLVIAPAEQPLTQLLSMSPEFHLTYKDKIAVLFVREAPTQKVLRVNRTQSAVSKCVNESTGSQ
jgi:hypothetical protein